MSVSKPAKQPRLMGQSEVKRTESVDLASHSQAMQEARDPLTSSTAALPQSTAMRTRSQAPTHPKGHKVRNLNDVWANMDGQSFLHLTDTLTLGDVWVQPKFVNSVNATTAEVTFVEMVNALHIKCREATTKISVDDLCKMLYLNDCLQHDAQGIARMSYDDWIAEKTACFIRQHGVEDSTNRSKICNFVITEDREYTFYPTYFKTLVGVFFRKICVHSYKTGEGVAKISNPSMIKCCAKGGKFEYILEARYIPLPEEWWKLINEEADTPEAQPIEV